MNEFVLYAQQASGDLDLDLFSGDILAVPFDPKGLVATGRSAPVLEKVRVHNGGAANYDVAANGTLVLIPGVYGTPRGDLAWFTVSGGNTATPDIQRLSGSPGLMNPRLSHDDRTVVMQTGTNTTAIYAYSTERGSLVRVPFDGVAQRPVFGPVDGTVTFASSTRQGLWFAPIDGSRPAERLTTSRLPQTPGSWSRDGAYLVFSEVKNGSSDIMVLRRGEREATPLVATASDETDPVLSPDDRWMAYASNESGRNEVYVRPFPGPGGRYAVSTEGGEVPAWSKDGRRLFYVRGGNTLMAVDAPSGPSFTASKPRVVVVTSNLEGLSSAYSAASRNFDVARDGRILVALNSDNESSRVDHMRVLLNFDAEIRRRAPIPTPNP